MNALQYRLRIERLEDRTVPTVSVNAAGVLVIVGTAENDTATVTQSSTTYQVDLNGVARTFARSKVPTSEVVFRGFDGNDSFTNSAPALKARAFGGDGDDTLVGSARADILYGGDGNDWLYGGAGNDHLDGQGGDDVVVAGAGKETV